MFTELPNQRINPKKFTFAKIFMAKNKLKKFNAYNTFPNTFDARNQLKGKWHETVFKNQNPITLELACGRGEYTVGLAQLYPDRNFIGVDVKAARMWQGAKFALDNGLNNIAFIRIQIDFLLEYFAAGEVSEIWITFPDPQPQKPRARQRLTSPQFLGKYVQLLKPRQMINLKTDSDLLFQYTLETIKPLPVQLHEVIMNIDDLDPMPPELSIKTYYENMWRSKDIQIKYLKFSFTEPAPTDQ
jgi:tRNA (guanine-N7-)-methyltransferase